MISPFVLKPALISPFVLKPALISTTYSYRYKLNILQPHKQKIPQDVRYFLKRNRLIQIVDFGKHNKYVFVFFRSLVTIPKKLLQTYESKTVIDNSFLQNSTLNMNEIADLVQWSSMVLFDYITGHYDR